MAALTHVLFLISTGLLAPVIVILLLLFARSLLLLGGFYALYIRRVRHDKDTQAVVSSLETTPEPVAQQLAPFLSRTDSFAACVRRLADAPRPSDVHRDKALSDYELLCEKELEQSRLIIRLAPMFGLMGTLIPMAPALAGLAAGDLSTMADNMQVAFATTVIGVMAGAIGYVSFTLKRRWFKQDMRTLAYVNARLAAAEGTPVPGDTGGTTP